jgi:hypothetical protein
MTINYSLLKNEIIQIMAAHPHMALATSAEDRTTCRSMNCVADDLTVYFQTSLDSTKYNHIVINPNVALCFGNASLEGTARLLGHPVTEPWFLSQYKTIHPESFRTYAFLENERVVCVSTKLVALWKKVDGKYCREILDPVNRKAERIWIDTSRRISADGI